MKADTGTGARPSGTGSAQLSRGSLQLRATLLAAALTGALAGTAAGAAGSPAPAAAVPASLALADGSHALHAVYYQRNWGLDIVGVRTVASGAMLEFRYRVLDPAKSRVVNDARSVPIMIDRDSGARLQVPALENIGALRQATAPRAGRTYWIVFGNPGHRVHPGSQVDVEIGAFRAEALIVD
jgi:hypothetical protein